MEVINMFKYKKYSLITITFSFLVVSFLELIKYLFVDSTFYGVIYLLLNLVIFFFLFPMLYNYKNNFSKVRISKLLIIILLMFVNSYILHHILFNFVSYVDTSKVYIESIYIYRNIFKGIILLSLVIFTIFESKLDKKIIKLLKSLNNKKKKNT